MISYILYFLGFVSFYRISEHLAEDDEPEWYHIIVGLIWPFVSALALLINIRDLIFGDKSES